MELQLDPFACAMSCPLLLLLTMSNLLSIWLQFTDRFEGDFRLVETFPATLVPTNLNGLKLQKKPLIFWQGALAKVFDLSVFPLLLFFSSDPH